MTDHTKADDDKLRQQAEAAGQGHVFRFWDQLDAQQRDALLGDLRRVDLALIERLTDRADPGLPDAGAGGAASASWEPVDPFPPPDWRRLQPEYERARSVGLDAVAAGRVAAMTVAGGQGTRLGFDGPKGVLAITPVRHKSLFQLLAEGVLAAVNRAGRSIPWYIMTGPANDSQTRRFFEDHDYFGLDPAAVTFFVQGVMPVLSLDGKLLLADRHRLVLAPDGHGGSIGALANHGLIDRMRRDGVDTLSYFQVDNPLVRPIDPLLIGLHLEHEADVSLVTIPKADDLERVGNLVRIDGRLHVIEYTEFPEALARARAVDGRRRFDAANLSIQVFTRAFLERVIAPGSGALPWHRAIKKAPYLDPSSGRRVEPEAPNAIKFERFVFDVLPLAERTVLLQSDRSECFSPVKNATGVDSAERARIDLSRRARRWLRICRALPDAAAASGGGGAAGDKVDAGSGGSLERLYEISPLLAQDACELGDAPRGRIGPNLIPPGTDPVYLE